LDGPDEEADEEEEDVEVVEAVRFFEVMLE
jgi:hypothetical protein